MADQHLTSPDLVIFLPSLAGGGAERFVLTISRQLLKRDYSLWLVLAQKKGDLLKDVPEGLRVIDLKAKGVARALFPLARLLKKYPPRTVLTTMTHANIIAILATRFAAQNIRVVAREASPIRGNKQRENGFKNKLSLYLARFIYRLADMVTSVSKGVARDTREILRLPDYKITHIYSPIDFDRLEASKKDIAQHDWFEDPTIQTIVTAGRLTTPKNFSMLLHAIALCNEQQDVRLILLGQGGLENSLKALAKELYIKDKVCFRGFVSNPYAYMRKADLYVLSSLWEGFPNSLIEALACGCRVVATDCPYGPAEIIEPQAAYGQLVTSDDASAMAQGILNTLALPHDEAPSLKRAQDFSSEEISTAYEALLFPKS